MFKNKIEAMKQYKKVPLGSVADMYHWFVVNSGVEVAKIRLHYYLWEKVTKREISLMAAADLTEVIVNGDKFYEDEIEVY